MFATMLGVFVPVFGVFGILCVLPFVVAAFAFWIWMLVHAVQNKGLTDSERIVWVLVIIFLHFLGALIYFVVGKPKQLR